MVVIGDFDSIIAVSQMSDTGDVSGQMFGVVQCAAFDIDYQFQSGCLDCDIGNIVAVFFEGYVKFLRLDFDTVGQIVYRSFELLL